jgi:hypothetical protein
MNKLNDTSSANLKVLGEGELSQVVGGWGGHRGGNRGGGQHHMSHGGGGGGGGRNRSNGGGNVSITFNITINNINNNNLF